MAKETGWKPLSLSLKILFVVLVLWLIGSLFALPTRISDGLPFFGVYVYGVFAVIIVLVLDIVGPIAFLYALWNRLSWGPKVAFAYMGAFVLSSVAALITVRDQIGFMPIFAPMLFTLGFMAIIYYSRPYFD